ncbi:MAG: cell division protein ZapA [Syntrophomonadaceae bacterium]|nr:cell division protein ZapA [Syntrophomonadaceae bacterium]
MRLEYRSITHSYKKGASQVDAKKSTVNKVTVSIYNEDYVVKGNEDPEYIQMLGSYVDRRMRMIGQRNHNLSTTKVAVLTALNLADELNKLQEDYDQMIKALEEERKNRLGQS